ncbi:MAG: thioesterase family protein [Alphaproteobacteria bacterium]|nr:thioesterase family protein [Alphaproteobacteria bacterium]
MSAPEFDPVTARGTVYPEHCDHMGHMNVAAYTKKFDEATWSLWVTAGMSHKAMTAEGTGLAALESNFTYKRELFPGDTYIIRSRFLKLRDRTATFHHRMYILDGEEETLAATCTYTAACLDRAAHRARSFPDAVAAKVRARLDPLPEEVTP